MVDLTTFLVRKKKDQRVKEFIDNILDMVIFVDESHHIQQVNTETLNILGYLEPQLIGKKIELLLGRHTPAHMLHLSNFLRQAPLRDYDLVFQKKNGVDLPVKINVTPLKDEIGTHSGWFITAKDMTETRSLIRDLARSRKEFQQTIRELEESQDELIRSEKLTFAGRMAASVAHEIRNPLNIIGMALQQLHNELRKKDPRREYTRIIMHHIDRVDKLITEFVNVARPPRLKLKWKDINMILENTLALMRPKFQERKVKIIKKLDSDLPKIKLDEEHITQAFSNILLNGLDAVPKRNGRISIDSAREENYAVIKIRNTGKPIPKKDLIRIFDPFFSTKKTGTGLGMSIVYGVIGSHKGTISVESSKKTGTIFTIKLPLPA